jgi:hypothetical protein
VVLTVVEGTPVLMYIELKTGYNDNGPAWMGRVRMSRSGRTVYFNGKAFKRSGRGSRGNHYDLETGEMYWISGVKKEGTDRHGAGSGQVIIEAAAVEEYLRVTGARELDRSRFVVSDQIEPADPSKFYEMENRKREGAGERGGATRQSDWRFATWFGGKIWR